MDATQLPEGNNFYVAFKAASKHQIREAFISYGWKYRKVSWEDFELENDWSELVLHGNVNEPLMAGAVIFNPPNVEKLDTVFASIGGNYQYEFYDDQKKLLLEKKNELSKL